MKNKLIAASAALVMTASFALPAFAHDDGNVSSSSSSSVTTDTSVASAADLSCMAAAVDAREGVVLAARADFNAKILAALTTRRASLKTAYAIANNADRKVAVKAALNVFAKASTDARAKYRADVKAGWKTFATATQNCNVDANVRVKNETRNDHDNGYHFGQLKKQIKNGFDFNMNGKADLDLSL